jgi:hypothetical protein
VTPHPARARIPSARATLSHKGRGEERFTPVPSIPGPIVKQPKLRRPYSLRRRARRNPSPPQRGLSSALRPDLREWSAERRNHQPTPCAVRTLWRRVRAPRRSIAAISVPGTVASGYRRRARAPRSGRLSPAFVRTASSHSRQTPNSRVGRFPGASRERGYEPRLQAPQPPPPSFGIHDNALGTGRMARNIVQGRN